jgi:hypothetical protein
LETQNFWAMQNASCNDSFSTISIDLMPIDPPKFVGARIPRPTQDAMIPHQNIDQSNTNIPPTIRRGANSAPAWVLRRVTDDWWVDQSTVKPIDIMGGESFNPASGAVCAPLRIWDDRG